MIFQASTSCDFKKMLKVHFSENGYYRTWLYLLVIYMAITAGKVSKYGVFSGPYFLVFVLNTGKYGPEKTPYLDTFYAVYPILFSPLVSYFS